MPAFLETRLVSYTMTYGIADRTGYLVVTVISYYM